jgi:mannose-6-phosphate isomerase-like protein (cupin superfamily)
MQRRNFLAMCGAVGLALPAETAGGSAKNQAGSSDPRVPVIIAPEQLTALSMGMGEARIVMDSERSNGAWWLGHFREDLGFRTPLHLHPIQDEQFYVLDGVLSIYVNGAWHDLTAGAYASVPKGTPHAQATGGNGSVVFLGGGNPAGFEKYFPDLAELAKRLKPSDPQWPMEVVQIVSRHDTNVLGPPPPRS